jgi:hypothetical protein
MYLYRPVDELGRTLASQIHWAISSQYPLPGVKVL